VPPTPAEIGQVELWPPDQVVGGTGLAGTVREGSEAEAESDSYSKLIVQNAFPSCSLRLDGMGVAVYTICDRGPLR